MRNKRGMRDLRARDIALLMSGTVAALGVALSPAAADALDGVKNSKKLVVCAVDGMLPYSSSDAKVPGFEVEIAQKMAEGLGATVEHAWVTWDALIPALTSNRCDVIIDGMFITAERQKVIDFSTPYYASGETILTRKDDASVKTLEDIKDKKVGVLAGSVTVDELQKKGIGELEVYPDQNTIVLELANHRIDAAYLEAPTAAWVIAADPDTRVKIVEEYVPEERFNAGIGVRKEDAALKAALDEIIGKMREDGTIKTVLEKYKVPYFPIAQ
ncbi:substrate-binding periplasmic protein [Mesorhizobium marinum]|uniref:substrate-binding periplasmic protein n=1 Tax=Mesorhizobium marinum TaxID=3228790 RepID=UPI003467305E